MDAKQLGILNALVTYAAENIPGGLSEDEREVAQIVGAAALMQPPETRIVGYKVENMIFSPDDVTVIRSAT